MRAVIGLDCVARSVGDSVLIALATDAFTEGEQLEVTTGGFTYPATWTHGEIEIAGASLVDIGKDARIRRAR